MKGNLRKLVIGSVEYRYSISDRFDRQSYLNKMTVSVFLMDKRRTALILSFEVLEHYYAGQPLKTGMNIFNKHLNAEVSVNLNEPKFIRQLVDLAIQKGWTGQTRMEIKNGLDWLSELGYDIHELREEAERMRVKTARLKKLGYTHSWVNCGLLTEEQLVEQERIFAEGEDQNTEHYRLGTCVHYLKSKKELSDLELDRYFMILKKDPNTYMAGSAAIEVFKWIQLTDKQFDTVTKQVAELGDWTAKIAFRESLIRKLKTLDHTNELIDYCIVEGDSFVQNYLLNTCDLNEDQLRKLSIHGKNKRIRTEAKIK